MTLSGAVSISRQGMEDWPVFPLWWITFQKEHRNLSHSANCLQEVTIHQVYTKTCLVHYNGEAQYGALKIKFPNQDNNCDHCRGNTVLSSAGRGSQSHHYHHHLQAFILLCWKVGGFRPGVLIFLVPNGSVLTADIPRPDPIPEPMPDPKGPGSKTWVISLHPLNYCLFVGVHRSIGHQSKPNDFRADQLRPEPAGLWL